MTVEGKPCFIFLLFYFYSSIVPLNFPLSLPCLFLGKKNQDVCWPGYSNRQTRGKHFEGTGGIEDKIAQTQRDNGGYNDNDVVTRKALGKADIVGTGKDRKGNEILDQGVSATRNNVGSNPPGPGGSQFKGEDYYRPESVPDSISAEGYVPPESVTQASRESELGSWILRWDERGRYPRCNLYY